MKSYESIIEGYQAIEMAEDFNFTNSKYIDETNNGYSIYYNYVCDYYFFVDENE